MRLAPNELARRTPDGSVFRHDAVPLSLAIGPIVSRDGHELSVRADLSVRIVEREADLELFKEQLLGAETLVTLDTVRQRLAPGLETSLHAFARQHDAETFLAQRRTIVQLLFERANEIGFACGLEFVPPAEAALSCPSLEARRAIERMDQERSDQFDRASKIIERARALGGADGLRPDEQATLLQLLVRGAPRRAAFVAAGKHLIELDPATGETRAIAPPPAIGPLRSVQFAPDGKRLLGGQRGAAIDDAFFLHPANTDRGINSIAVDALNRVVVAAHSELGLLRWNLETAELLAPIDPPDEPARSLIAIDERILFAAGARLMQINADQPRPVYRAEAPILDIHVTPDSAWIVCENGTIDRLSRANPGQRLGRFHRSAQLHASALIVIDAMTALALAGESGPVEIVSTTGSPLLELHGPYEGLRMLAACGAYVVGISADRQTAVVWDLNQPQTPARTINLVARHGHRAADVACGSA